MGTEFDEFAGLADAVEQAFISGIFNAPPKEGTVDPEMQRFEHRLMRDYTSSVLPSTRLKAFKKQNWDIRLLAQYCAGEFKKWQDITQDNYRKKGLEAQAGVVKGITLAGIANFARDQFHEFSAAAGQAHPNSRTQKDMLERADYWGWTEQVIKEASEGQNKNPLI